MMAIRIASDADSGQPTVTFIVNDRGERAVSVVGSFNDWVAGVNPLEPTSEGTLTVTVAVDPGRDLHFRYLGSDDEWFDEPDADEITNHGSVITAARLEAASEGAMFQRSTRG
jgi:1,4-alpha-glucan branching enzyme